MESAHSLLFAQEVEIARDQRQPGADPVRERGGGDFEAAAAVGSVVPVSADGAARGSGLGVPATVYGAKDQRGDAAFVSVRVGGTGIEVRIPGAVRAAGPGA